MKRRGRKPATETETPKAGSAAAPPVAGEIEDSGALFRDSVRDVSPLRPSGKTNKPPVSHPPPVPRGVPQGEWPQHHRMPFGEPPLEIEPGDEWSFSRPGVSHQTLRRLRHGYWSIEAQLDLHGYNRDEAVRELYAFLDESHRRGFRCVRVVHGKGLSSRDHEPVLKARIGGWLANRNEVLAFCQAKPQDGGSGAVLVLLKSFEGD